MPSISVLPSSPGVPSFEPSNHTTAKSFTRPQDDNISISEIKEKAIEAVRRETRGASALALVKAARTQYMTAGTCESQGDLKGALSAFTKAASLAKMVFDTTEYQAETRGAKGGVVKKEFSNFLERDSTDLTHRLHAVEEKLKAMEKASPTSTDGPIIKPGGTIADRMKALQDSGLSISTSKRFIKEVQNLPSPNPSSGTSSPMASSNRLPPTNIVSSTPPTALSTLATLSAPTGAAGSSSSPLPAPHSFVSPSSLGPPSPSSSPPSSPTIPNYSISEFNNHFPSIDELDENPTFSLPSIPTGLSTGSNKSASSGPKDGDTPLVSPTPHAALRNFIVPVERPSSTPLTPTTNAFISRPTSPSGPKAPVPIKPSGLSTSVSLNGDTHSPSSKSSPLPAVKPSIPNKNAATPKELQRYLREYKVLLLDVRDRADFDREHIKAIGGAVVCIEPTVLKRGTVTADTLEDAMVIAPSSENSTFNNRHKFELVVVYDESSETFGPPHSIMNVLIQAICEKAFRKPLKRMPMILIGGLQAWKKEFGPQEVVGSGDLVPSANGVQLNGITLNASSINGLSYSSSPNPVSSPIISSPIISASLSHSQANPFASGGALASPLISSGVSTPGAGPLEQQQQWAQAGTAPSSGLGSRSRADTNPSGSAGARQGEHRSNHSLDQGSFHARSPAETSYSSRVPHPTGPASLARKPAMSISRGASLPHSISENNIPVPPMSPPLINGASPITYPSFSRPPTSALPSHSPFTSTTQFDITSPPQASINPSLSRRRSDYVDQSQEALSGLNSAGLSSRSPIDYPELSSTHIPRPPPIAASSALERHDNRPRLAQQTPFAPSPLPVLEPPSLPRIKEGEWPTRYWSDSLIATSGLKNLGNTCYMNAPIQCLSATAPFAMFFTEVDVKKAVNYLNKNNSRGELTRGFARLIHDLRHADMPYLTPTDFRKTLVSLNKQYMGTDQHDSQEFLSFLLDGIHEDLNRIIHPIPINRTPEEEERLERLPQQIASDQEWQLWKRNNDSVIVDYFQGQFRSQLKCLTCQKTSTTYNAFSILSLPISGGQRNGKVPLQNCLKAFFNMEILENDDAWDCPRCKIKRRASKTLSLARLPPILVIHLKRFETNGRFSDKIDTFVDFPLKSLDLTDLMPPPLPPGADHTQLNGGVPLSPDDPRTQLPPYKYELYGVTNHYGNLSSGHYTAFVASRNNWLYCDDSSIKSVDSKQVVSQKAYVLFYKRTKA